MVYRALYFNPLIMPEDKIDFSEDKPTGGGKQPGAYKAVSVSAKVIKTETDRSGKEYHDIQVDFEYDNGKGEEENPTMRSFFRLPYDYWKDGSREPASPFFQFCSVLKKSLKDFNGKSVSEAFVGLDITILVGAQRH